MSRPDGWQQGWSYSEGALMTGHSVGSVNVSYTYESAAPVTGKLQTMTQNGDTVTYGYDVQGRLSSATSAAWNQSYTYDGFSNLLQKTGSTGTQNWSRILNSEKNQIGQYDAAGNAIGYTWDAGNRLQFVAPSKYYLYDSSNQRVVEFTDGQNSDTAVVTLRAGGMMLGRYTYDVNVTATLTTWQEFKYLGGRRTDVGSDRLGSDVTGNRTLLPYGEELTPTANGATKFATYWRDADTAIDYADQRYHSPGVGKFLSADPYMASGGPANPSSWNRYVYVEGDPVNWVDPAGREKGPPINPYDGLLNLIWTRLQQDWRMEQEAPADERSELQKALDETTKWGRAWAIDGLRAMKQDCKNALAERADNAWDLNMYHRLMNQAQFVRVADLSNVTIWGADWGIVTDTGVAGFTSMEYQQAQRAAGIEANAVTLGNTIVLMQDRDDDWIGNSPSPLLKRMVHELMHTAYGTHAQIAEALFGTELGSAVSEIQVNTWLGKCF